MHKLLFTAVSALGLACAAAPLTAQTAAMPAMPGMAAMSADQTTSYNGWEAAQRTAYDAWPVDYQTYYWTLSPTQMRGWWILNDTQRKQIFDMTPAQRASMWTSIEGQMIAGSAGPSGAAPVQANPVGSDAAPTMAPDPATADTAVAPTMPADPSYQAGPYKGAMSAPPAEAMNKVYPLCTKTLRDSCRNRGGK